MAGRDDPAVLPRRTAVAIAISDPFLARRIGSLLSGDDGLEVFLDLDDDRDPDVILTDHAPAPAGPAIIIDDGAAGPDAPDADVRAVLPASVDAELLRAAIRIVAAGFTVTHAGEPRGFSDDASEPDRFPAADDGGIALTPREAEVLGVIARGAPNKLIARELAISVHTAKFHVAAVLAKLGARNRSDAVAIGIRRGSILL